MKGILIVVLSVWFLPAFCQMSAEDQIASSVLAAPEEMRNEAGVMGYNDEGKLVVLREPKNDILCLADDPNRTGFSAACYHKDLDTFMARGRALRAEGMSPAQIDRVRSDEAKTGKMKMPEQPTTLHVLSGNDGKYNAETGEVENVSYRYVVYIPYATSETTGLPTRPPAPGHPWIMFPGTYRAHIMITPPRDQ